MAEVRTRRDVLLDRLGPTRERTSLYLALLLFDFACLLTFVFHPDAGQWLALIWMGLGAVILLRAWSLDGEARMVRGFYADLVVMLRRLERSEASHRRVLAEREHELRGRLGACRWSRCRLHYAHAGPCDMPSAGASPPPART